MSYKERFLDWFEKEKAEKGLISVQVALDPFTAFDVDEHMDSLDEDVYQDLLYIVENWDEMEPVIEVSPMTYREKLKKFLEAEKNNGVTYAFARDIDYEAESVCKELYHSITAAYAGRGISIKEL